MQILRIALLSSVLFGITILLSGCGAFSHTLWGRVTNFSWEGIEGVVIKLKNVDTGKIEAAAVMTIGETSKARRSAACGD